jgi:NDT80 / PhoG like DNA-binding  family
MDFPTSQGLQHPSMLKRFSSSHQFDDQFAEGNVAQYDRIQGEGMSESPSIDRDSKYLSFSMPQYNFTLLDDSFRRSSVNINAQLHGMFFLAESQWPATPDAPPPPPELTCYRRNLFQITGSITLPRNLRYVFTDDGSRIPIYELELSVSATESVEENPVKIISVPWKTPSGGETAKPDDKIEREPPSLPLDKMSGQDLDTDFTTFPIQWKRLQFRIATANNGRRKELQQHFTLHLKIMASLSTGGKISIAEAHSGAIIVRGRSPRNFAARKDLPLSSSSTARKHVSAQRGSQTSVPQVTSAPKMKTPPDELSQAVMHFEPVEDLNHWQGVSMPGDFQTPYATSRNPPTMPPMMQGTPNPFFTFTAGIGSAGPESLHFSSDDEGSPHPPQRKASRPTSAAPTSNPSPNLMNKPRSATFANVSVSPPPHHPDTALQRPRLQSHQTSLMSLPSTTMATGGASQRPDMIGQKSGLPFSPAGESADHLYEYFPLGIEDWLPPVDALFRPHVVHHETPLPIDPRSPGVGRNTSKRYFSEVA